MTAEPETEDKPGEGADPAPRRKRRGRRRRRAAVGLVSLGLLAALLVGGLIGLFALRADPVVAPDWVRDQIEIQLGQAADPYELSIGQASFVIEDGWSPKVLLSETQISDAAGARLVSFERMSVGLAMRPLLGGAIRPTDVTVSGTRFGVRRDTEGAFWLSFDEAIGGGAEFAEMGEEVDRLFARDELSAFERFELRDVTVLYEDERARRSWTVDGGRMLVSKEGAQMRTRADFALLTGGATAAGVELTLERDQGANEAFIGMNLSDFPAQDLATQSPALSWLDAVRAPISGALRVTMSDTGVLGRLNATLQIGAGALQPNAATNPVPFRSARTYLTYDPDVRIITFDEIAVEGEWATLTAEAKLGLETGESGWPESFVGQFRFADIEVNPGELLPVPVAFDDGFADLRLSVDPFRVDLGQLNLYDGEARFHGEGSFEALDDGWSYRVQAAAADLELADVLAFWPEDVNRKTRKWVDENVREGRVTQAQFALKATPGERPEPHFSFSYEDVRMRFMKTMPELDGLAGHASLLRKRFAAMATSGTMTAPQGGKLDVTGTEFIIPRTKPKPAKARVNLAAEGRITALLSVLDLEPLGFLRKAGQPVTLADGDIRVTGSLGWTMKKPVPIDQVEYDMRAVASDVRSQTIVPGRVLAAPRLDITADGETLVVAGQGRLGSVPVSGRFTAPLGPVEDRVSKAEGTVELSPRFVEEFRLGLPSGTVSGSGRGEIELALRRGAGTDFTLTSSLEGVGLAIPQIGWRKPESAEGRLQVTGVLGEGQRIDEISLSAAGLDASGTVKLTDDQFEEARFERVTIGSWLDLPLRIVGRGEGLAPRIELNGGRIDLSQTTLGSGGSGAERSDGSPINARLDTLKISDGIELNQFRGEFDTAGGFTGGFTGQVNGQASVSGRVVPQSGRSAFRIAAEDGGQVLKSAGLLKNASGGDFELILSPASATGSYNGSLEMSGVRLKDAPAMAALLNAISVVGLLEQLGGSGILFNEVEARFQLTPEALILSRSSAVGASMGISMDGYYGLATGAMDMQGVVSPVYLVNGIGQIFTRKGEGLVGFNYDLRGSASDPQVQVNPLSIFTPGMFREIFRRPAPQVQR